MPAPPAGGVTGVLLPAILPRVPEPVSPMYRFAMTTCAPVVRWWGRAEVSGLEHVPEHGPVLMAVNHDSHWDPVAIGVVALRRRQVRALAKASLWKNPVLGRILDGMGQIQLHRGASADGGMPDALRELRAGACIGIFPEGTLSRGEQLRARSGLGRLARDTPGAVVVCAAVADTVTLARFPRRPRITVRFFPPAGGGLQPDESPADFAARLVEEIRAEVPWVAAGRARGRAARPQAVGRARSRRQRSEQ